MTKMYEPGGGEGSRIRNLFEKSVQCLIISDTCGWSGAWNVIG